MFFYQNENKTTQGILLEGNIKDKNWQDRRLTILTIMMELKKEGWTKTFMKQQGSFNEENRHGKGKMFSNFTTTLLKGNLDNNRSHIFFRFARTLRKWKYVRFLRNLLTILGQNYHTSLCIERFIALKSFQTMIRFYSLVNLKLIQSPYKFI